MRKISMCKNFRQADSAALQPGHPLGQTRTPLGFGSPTRLKLENRALLRKKPRPPSVLKRNVVVKITAWAAAVDTAPRSLAGIATCRCLSPRGEHPARRKSAAPEPVERNLETGSIVEKLAANSPFAPPRQASFFRPLPLVQCSTVRLWRASARPFLDAVPCSDRKARSSSRPCKSRVIGAPAACQKRRSRDRSHPDPRAPRT
jgi:hypothetical protein